MRLLKGKVALGLAVTMLVSGLTYQAKPEKNVQAADEYTLVWSDEFDGNDLNRKNWNVEIDGKGGGNEEHQYYLDNKNNIDVSNGTLKIHALKQSYAGKDYTSGRITTQNKKTFLYGKVEARMKLPRFQGAWPAFWMLGNNINQVGWPKCGEMDIMEAINNDNNVYANLHWSYQNSNADTKGTAYNVGDRTAWHTYGMEWTETMARFYVDGHVYQVYSISNQSEMQEFREKQFIIFNLAIGGRWPGHTIDDTAFPSKSTMEVDWVRVYQKGVAPTTKPPVTETYVISEEDVDVVQDANKNFSTYNAGNNSNWAGSAVISGETMTSNGGTVQVEKVGSQIWGLQVHSSELEAIAGNTYTLSTTLTSSIDKQVRIKVRGNDMDDYIFLDKTLYLKAGVPQTLLEQVEVPDYFEGFLKLDYGFGKNQDTNEQIAENTPFQLQISNTTMLTHKVNYGVIVKEEVTKARAKTKTAKELEKEFQNKCGKAKVKLATKKKSSKKIKVTLKKKLIRANGYQVKLYSSKKNAKKNKKAIVKFKTKNNNKVFKFSSKKLKGKKKLYIRVRGYKKIGKKTVYYKKWSVLKKVRVK
ncbi:MAG: glycoside hydrolase family 16 protein [Eubacterium sp.]|nr:glycoside hydrolase family 16 protein [Eubacterium sp.]